MQLKSLGAHLFSESLEAIPKFKGEKGDRKQVPSSGPEILEWSNEPHYYLALTVWCIHIPVRKVQKSSVIILRLLGGTLQNLVAGTFAPLDKIEFGFTSSEFCATQCLQTW